jgi:lipopolysaccharide transport system permease protein
MMDSQSVEKIAEASNNLEVRVYSPDSALKSPQLMIYKMWCDLLASRELAWRFAIRDIRAQYRQTALGFLWVFMLPLANTAVWLFFQRSGIVSIQETVLPYPVYVLTGTILWAIFMDAVNSPLQQTSAAKPMLAKINFPRESLILSGLIQTFFNAFIKIAVLLVALILLGVMPGWQLIFFPFAVFSLILAGTTLGLAITPIGMLYTDIGKGLPLLMQFLMYTTPVVFPMPTSGLAATVIQFNPLTPLLLTARDLITGYTPDHLGAYFFLNSTMIVLFCLMWIIYRSAMPILTERIDT